MNALLLGYKPNSVSLGEKLIGSVTAGLAIFCLVLFVD
jgi:hypothetical protein